PLQRRRVHLPPQFSPLMSRLNDSLASFVVVPQMAWVPQIAVVPAKPPPSVPQIAWVPVSEGSPDPQMAAVPSTNIFDPQMAATAAGSPDPQMAAVPEVNVTVAGLVGVEALKTTIGEAEVLPAGTVSVLAMAAQRLR